MRRAPCRRTLRICRSWAPSGLAADGQRPRRHEHCAAQQRQRIRAAGLGYHAAIHNWTTITDPTDTAYPAISIERCGTARTPRRPAKEVLDGSKPVGPSTARSMRLQNSPSRTTPASSNRPWTGVNFFSAAGRALEPDPPQFPPPIVIPQPITLTLSLQRRTSKGGQVIPELPVHPHRLHAQPDRCAAPTSWPRPRLRCAVPRASNRSGRTRPD